MVTRLDARHGSRLPRCELVDGVRVVRVSSRGPGKIGSLRYLLGGLAVLARNGRKQIYHAHDLGTPGVLAGVASRMFGGRSIVKLRTGASVYQSRFHWRSLRLLFRALLRWHDRIIVVNTEVENWLVELGVSRHRISRVPNAVDGELYRKAAATERHDARLALRLPMHTAVVLCVGRLVRVKGVDVLLSAWSSLPARVRGEAILVIVGGGPARPDLDRLVDSLGIHDSVVMAGPQATVQEYYRAADLFVLPSRAEGLSNALLEAMASELPVVATSVGGARDVVQNGVNGILVAPDDAQDLSRALGALLDRRPEWNALGARGRQAVLEYAGLEGVLDKLERVYTAVAEN